MDSPVPPRSPPESHRTEPLSNVITDQKRQANIEACPNWVSAEWTCDFRRQSIRLIQMEGNSTTSRPTNRSIALQLWLVGAIVPISMILLNYSGIFDFGALWVAGKLALSGNMRIYDADVVRALAQQFTGGGESKFPYPPHALFFFMPFAMLPYKVAYVAWNVTTALFFCVAARPYLPKGFHPILPILTPAALTCFHFGQTGMLLGGLWLFAFRGSWASVALLTFKPHLGVLSVLALRGRRAFVWATLAVCALVGLSLLAFGQQILVDFFHHSIGHVGEFGHRKSWLRAGVSPGIGLGLIGWIPFAVAAGLILARNINAFSAATASLLISPYGFNYDMVAACLGFGLLVFAHWDRMPVHHRIATMLGFLVPVLVKAGAWWMPPILLWALWVQVKYPAFGPQFGRETSRSTR
ncbi:MAG: glycosyltransferase family 87 protein [Sphingomicrobium sp.]